MSKPSIFFSHSSNDRNQLLILKNLIFKYTGGTLEIFMSSDGESIPFGRNWVHKIEEGLNKASIMFVFVTPTSINSNWIYFEAGYAYSKGIEVIPVALGVEIGLLKAPLNLLQGFNLSSTDSLNNFISIVNKKFDFSFEENFSDKDYSKIVKNIIIDDYSYELSNVFSKVKFSVSPKYTDDEGEILKRDLNEVYQNLLSKLDKLNCKYSLSESSREKMILVAGIKLVYKFNEIKDENREVDTSKDSIDFKISTYNFDKSISILNELSKCIANKKSFYLWFLPTSDYKYISDDEDISSLMFVDSELYDFDDIRPNIHSFKNAKFAIFDRNRHNHSKMNKEQVLSVFFEDNQFHIKEFYELVQYLLEKKIISK